MKCFLLWICCVLHSSAAAMCVLMSSSTLSNFQLLSPSSGLFGFSKCHPHMPRASWSPSQLSIKSVCFSKWLDKRCMLNSFKSVFKVSSLCDSTVVNFFCMSEKKDDFFIRFLLIVWQDDVKTQITSIQTYFMVALSNVIGPSFHWCSTAITFFFEMFTRALL